MSKKKKVNVVYSTNPDYSYDFDESDEIETPENSNQNLYVSIDRKQRAGKEVTLIEGFKGGLDDLKDLAKFLKSRCGVGGAVKNGEILIQGNHKQKINDLLVKEGYTVKMKGGN